MENKYLSFEEAREYVRGLGLKSYNEWLLYKKSVDFNKRLPNNLYYYKKENEDFNIGRFLGYKKEIIIKYEDIREFLIKNNLEKIEDWLDFKRKYKGTDKLPENIPLNLDEYIRKLGFKSFYSFIKNNKNGRFLPFEEAREYVRGLGLKSHNEWRKFSKSDKRPKNIPSSPNTVYKNDGWVDIGDWLGYNCVKYLSFEEAREYVKSLNIKSIKEYKKMDIDNIPKCPDIVYKDKGWINWRTWLFGEYVSYENAKKFGNSLNLKTRNDWIQAKKENKIPLNIPQNPDKFYKKTGEWENWTTFLGDRYNDVVGYDFMPFYVFMSFKEACDYVRKLDLRNEKNWRKYKKSGNKPINLPAHPDRTYKSEWISWPHFLCYKFPNADLMFSYCIKNGIDSSEKYYEHWLNNPGCGLPYNPITYYNLREVEKL